VAKDLSGPNAGGHELGDIVAVGMRPSGGGRVALVEPPKPGEPTMRWISHAHSIDEIELELNRIWAQPDLVVGSDEERPFRHIAARTSVMNLVVVARQPEVGERTAETIQRLTGRHPSRTLIVLSASLLFCEEAAQLAPAAMRLDGKAARMHACRGAAQFNLRPMPREHDVLAMRSATRIDAHIDFGHRDRLPIEAPLETHGECPAEERHLEARKRQNGPESLQREHPGDAARHDAGDAEEQARAAHTE